jgi:hypothetical protein
MNAGCWCALSGIFSWMGNDFFGAGFSGFFGDLDGHYWGAEATSLMPLEKTHQNTQKTFRRFGGQTVAQMG